MDGCEEGNLKRKMHAQRKILQLQPFQILKMQIFLHCSIWTWFCDGIGCTFFLYFTWPFHKIQFERTSQGKYQGNLHFHKVKKLPKMSQLIILSLTFSINFCVTKGDLSGNTVWPQTSGFPKLAKLTIFGIFDEL